MAATIFIQGSTYKPWVPLVECTTSCIVSGQHDDSKVLLVAFKHVISVVVIF